MIHTWESVAVSDKQWRRDALLAIKALARLAGDDCRVSITKRDLADAMLGTDPYPGMNAIDAATGQRRSEKGWEMAAARALQCLTGAGYLARVNPDAPRNKPGLYLLTIPAPRLVDA